MASRRQQQQPRSRQLPYQEGSWFQVPLKAGGPVVVGVAARIDGGGGLLGYFYLLDKVPTVAQLGRLKASDAQAVMRLGDLHLIEGRWRILSEAPVPGWERSQWPIPAFKLYESLRGRWEIRTYDETLRLPTIRPATAAEVEGLPRDGLAGAEAVELQLQQLAGSTKPVRVQRLAA